MSNKTKTIGLLSSLLIIVFIVSIYAYRQVDRSGKIAVQIITAPNDATVKIGDTTTGNGTAYIKPGKYKLSVSKDGFETYKDETFTVRNGELENFVTVSLLAQSDEAVQWAEKNESQYFKVEELGGLRASQEGEAFSEKQPISRLLPIDRFEFKIGYITGESDDDITLTVHAKTPIQRHKAIQHIKELGYDPVDFKITYTDYINPLNRARDNHTHEED